MEQINENVFTNTKIRGCNPSFVLTKEGAVFYRHAATDYLYSGDAGSGLEKRSDPLFNQY